jgi:methionine-gamma-lyase
MQTDDLVGSSYRLEGDELDRYRELAGDGIFRLSVGLEDADDLIKDLAEIL